MRCVYIVNEIIEIERVEVNLKDVEAGETANIKLIIKLLNLWINDRPPVI
jgi:hypothetical protein